MQGPVLPLPIERVDALLDFLVFKLHLCGEHILVLPYILYFVVGESANEPFRDYLPLLQKVWVLTLLLLNKSTHKLLLLVHVRRESEIVVVDFATRKIGVFRIHLARLRQVCPRTAPIALLNVVDFLSQNRNQILVALGPGDVVQGDPFSVFRLDILLFGQFCCLHVQHSFRVVVVILHVLQLSEVGQLPDSIFLLVLLTQVKLGRTLKQLNLLGLLLHSLVLSIETRCVA